MKQLKKLTLIIFGILLFNSCQGNSQEKTTVSSNLETITDKGIVEKTYRLKGFKQSCCVGIVAYSLKEVKGYIKSKADIQKQSLTVWFDTNKCTESAIKKAINKTPYKIVN